VFQELLRRAPSGAELSSFVGLLVKGVSRAQVVLDLESGPEYRGDLVTSFYRSFLGRGPSPTELTGGVHALASGHSDEQLEAALLGSPGFFASAGSTNPSFVNALYADLLGRPPSSSEAGGWLTALSKGTSRTTVAKALLSSPEYRGDLAGKWYQQFLLRPVTPSERSAVIAALSHGASDEQVVAGILGSPEFYHLFTPATITSLGISPRGRIKVTLAQPVSIDLVVSRVVRRGTSLLPAVQHLGAVDASVKRFKLPKLRLVGIVHLGHHRGGRVILHWNRRVKGRGLAPGTYELVLEVRAGARLLDLSDAIRFTVR
jgi:hypothetical protein